MSKTKLYTKLAKAEKNYDPVLKNAYNPHFKSKFANLNSLLEAVTKALTAEGLLLLQPVENDKVVTMVVDTETGESITSSILIPTSITDPQKIGAAITYFRRFSLQALLGLTAEDDDGNYASGKVDKLEAVETAKKTAAPVANDPGAYKRPLGQPKTTPAPAATPVVNGASTTKTQAWD